MALSKSQLDKKRLQVNLLLMELSEEFTTEDRLTIIDSSLRDVEEFAWGRAVWEIKEQLSFYHSTSARPDCHHKFFKNGGLCATRRIENANRALGKLGKGHKEGRVDRCCETCYPHDDCTS